MAGPTHGCITAYLLLPQHSAAQCSRHKVSSVKLLTGEEPFVRPMRTSIEVDVNMIMMLMMLVQLVQFTGAAARIAVVVSAVVAGGRGVMFEFVPSESERILHLILHLTRYNNGR